MGPPMRPPVAGRRAHARGDDGRARDVGAAGERVRAIDGRLRRDRLRRLHVLFGALDRTERRADIEQPRGDDHDARADEHLKEPPLAQGAPDERTKATRGRHAGSALSHATGPSPNAAQLGKRSPGSRAIAAGARSCRPPRADRSPRRSDRATRLGSSPRRSPRLRRGTPACPTRRFVDGRGERELIRCGREGAGAERLRRAVRRRPEEAALMREHERRGRGRARSRSRRSWRPSSKRA